MPLLEHAVIGPFARNRQSIKLSRETDGEVAHVDHLLDFSESLAFDFSGLQRDEQAKIVFVFAQCVADLPHDLAALRRGNEAPLFEAGDG
jgi:hypothetical protein